MKSKIIIILIIAVVLGGFWFAKNKISSSPEPVQKYSSSQYGISFSYPENYVLSEQDISNPELQAHHSIILMRKEDLPPPVDGEYPPSITIDIYPNTSGTAEAWARTSPQSNFNSGEKVISNLTIAGEPAISYRWSGLYEGTTIATVKSNTLYVLTVTYLEMGAPIVQDFVTIRDSIKF
jgi:hypothetical protein